MSANLTRASALASDLLSAASRLGASDTSDIGRLKDLSACISDALRDVNAIIKTEEERAREVEAERIREVQTRLFREMVRAIEDAKAAPEGRARNHLLSSETIKTAARAYARTVTMLGGGECKPIVIYSGVPSNERSRPTVSTIEIRNGSVKVDRRKAQRHSHSGQWVVRAKGHRKLHLTVGCSRYIFIPGDDIDEGALSEGEE